MGTERLTAMKSTFEADIAKLQGDEKAASARQKAMLSKMRTRFEDKVANGKSVMANAEQWKAKQESSHDKEQKAIDEADAKAVELGEDIFKERKQLAALQARLGQKALASYSCRKCGKSLLLAAEDASAYQNAAANPTEAPAEQASLSLLRRGGVVTQKEGGVEHALLVREVEALELQRAKLQEAIERGATNLAVEQRRIMDKSDEVGVKLRGQGARNEQTQYDLNSKTARLKNHRKKAEHFRDVQAGALKRLQDDRKSVEAKLKKLEAAMARCGC